MNLFSKTNLEETIQNLQNQVNSLQKKVIDLENQILVKEEKLNMLPEALLSDEKDSLTSQQDDPEIKVNLERKFLTKRVNKPDQKGRN